MVGFVVAFLFACNKFRVSDLIIDNFKYNLVIFSYIWKYKLNKEMGLFNRDCDSKGGS